MYPAPGCDSNDRDAQWAAGAGMTPDGDCSPDGCGASNNSGGQSPGGERNCQELHREDGGRPLRELPRCLDPL
jgi:hypothetical protein